MAKLLHNYVIFGSHFVFGGYFFSSKCDFFSYNLFRQSKQNLESVAQEMSELRSILQFGGHFVLFRLSIQTSMKNLDSVAQEMSELCSIQYLTPFPSDPLHPCCDEPTYRAARFAPAKNHSTSIFQSFDVQILSHGYI